MGSKCSTLQIGGKVHISGNGNSPLIINGIIYNISSLFNTVVSMTMRQYRSELILVQFISAFVVLISVLLAVRFLISRFPVDKGFLPTQRKHGIQYNTDILEYQKHFEEFDRALREVTNVLPKKQLRMAISCTTIGIHSAYL
ncbi:unnamed protein product [Rotaria magnacalcarata]|uniref:Uncharacterized protein n=1 Tax=Rotaria magnacalcarata TaxID=392030 RepID=A0A8S3EVE0_9BILA|nr:unnamed protein product [Rotaria magnacalcarata]